MGVHTLLPIIPQHGERRGAQHSTAHFRKRQLCCHTKQINRKVRIKKKISALLHWIDLRVSACCWRNRFFHLLGSHFYQCMRWAPTKARQERNILFLPSVFSSSHLSLPIPTLPGRPWSVWNSCPPWGPKSWAPGLTGVQEGRGHCSSHSREKCSAPLHIIIWGFQRENSKKLFFFLVSHPQAFTCKSR